MTITVRWYHRLQRLLAHKLGRCNAMCSYCYAESEARLLAIERDLQ
jgi:sulfatase maturation enzyme AslB (radical SAM superfamily)